MVSWLMLFPVSMRIVAPGSDGAPSSKDCSVPFPCQHRTCGCRSAQQCWKKCCCFTNSQKLAWAKANRVQAPAFVVAAAQREASAEPAGNAGETCCTTKGKAKPIGRASAQKPTPRPTGRRVQFSVGIDALQCQGVEQTITGQLVCVPPPQPITIAILNIGVCEVMSLCDSRLFPCEQEPPTPPPRLLTV
jgi:hypothetical protein